MITRTHSREEFSFRDTAQILLPCCSKYIQVHRGRLRLPKVRVHEREPSVYYYRAVGMYERTPRDQAHPSRVPLELISSGCFYKLPFSKYYSTHTHTSAAWLVLDSSEMLRRFWGSLGVSSPWGARVDAGGTSSATSTPSSPPSSATPKLEEMEAFQRAELLSSCGQKERKKERKDCYVLL